MRRTPLPFAVFVVLAACGNPQDASVSTPFGQASVCPDSVAWQTAAPAGLNARVATFARSKLGTKVERGECSDLADQALRQAGAKTAYQLGPMGNDADYVWGTQVATIGGAARIATGLRPGDVLQYRDFAQEVDQGATLWSSRAPHHTALVKAVAVDGKHICVYEQNAGGRRYVGTGYISLAGMTAGRIAVYRPTP